MRVKKILELFRKWKKTGEDWLFWRKYGPIYFSLQPEEEPDFEHMGKEEEKL